MQTIFPISLLTGSSSVTEAPARIKYSTTFVRPALADNWSGLRNTLLKTQI